MKKFSVGAFGLVLAFLVSGCGGSVESIMEEQIKIDEDAADLAAGMKTAADVEASRPKFEALGKRSVDVLKKMMSFKGGSPAEVEAATKKLQARADAAKKKLDSAPPEVQEAIEQIITETVGKQLMP